MSNVIDFNAYRNERVFETTTYAYEILRETNITDRIISIEDNKIYVKDIVLNRMLVIECDVSSFHVTIFRNGIIEESYVFRDGEDLEMLSLIHI